jgi:DNA replication protein DnaC
MMDRNELPIHRLSDGLPDFSATINRLEHDPHLEEREREIEELNRRNAEYSVRTSFYSIVPAKYNNAVELKARNKAQQNFNNSIFLEWEKMRSGERKVIILCGEPGIGKTYTMCYLIWLALHTQIGTRLGYAINWHCCYINARTIAHEYHAADSFNSVTDKDHIAVKYAQYDLLCIDEVGRSQSSEQKEAILDILEQSERNIIFASNLELAEFAGYLGAAAMDRIAGIMVCPVTKDMESWRMPVCVSSE